MEPITFWASVAKVQTMADGGLRFVLDAPEGALEAMAALAYAQANGIVLDVTCKEQPKTLTDLDHETEKDSEGSRPEVDNRRRAIRRNQ